MKVDKCVSVVIPFFNGNKYIEETIDSLELNRDYISEVIICVDKYSENVILKKNYSFPIEIISNKSEKSGAGVVRSIGFNKAESKYVAFIDADDIWLENKLSSQINQMKKLNLAFSFHAFAHANDQISDASNPIVPKGIYNLQNFLKKSFTVGCLTVAINKDLIISLEPNELNVRNDYRMWFDVIRKCDEGGHAWQGLEFFGALHRIHQGSITRSWFKSAVGQYIFLKSCGFNYLQATYYFMYYVFNTIKSRILKI